jgi:FMN hydrolase / 5-amino-6-(5-phospho-D-ribitylamino)uracil phosphatase
MPVRYRVLSLDLHDTVVWDTPAIVEAQYEVRWSLLAQGLRMSNGGQVPLEELRRAREALSSKWNGEGRPVESVAVAAQVDQIRQLLGAQYASPVEQVVQRYAEGGLTEHPPVFDPEAQALVRHLNDVGLPVVMITDTSRSGSAWKSFLEGAGGMRLAHVIASTDVGACKPDPRIFAEAARRAGVPASEVLHVGDSWMWDVEGARGSGMGAALYRGLRAHYWDPVDPREDPPAIDPSIPCLDHLSEVRSLLGLA